MLNCKKITCGVCWLRTRPYERSLIAGIQGFVRKLDRYDYKVTGKDRIISEVRIACDMIINRT